MAESNVVDIAGVIERQPLGWFTVRLILVAWFVTFFDGYDMTVISFASKQLMQHFQMDKGMLGWVFTSGIAGTFVGALAFGFVADIIGRRPAIIISTAAFSVLTFAMGFAQSYEQMLLLRFLNGIALGGAIPLLWALNIEFVPKRFRARIVTLTMLGYGFGITACGPLSRWLIPEFGWPGIFWFGGIASLGSTLLLLLVLPESLRFLTSKGADATRIIRALGKMAPTFPVPANPRFVLSDEAVRKAPFQPGELFRGPLVWITPLIWLAYIASSMAAYFLTNWGPLILEEMGFGANGAAWVTAANSLCGAVGALVIMNFTDGKGPISIIVLPLVAVPLLLIAGLAPMGLSTFFWLGLVLSVFLGGSQYAIQSICGIFYPSAYRANGTGWAGSIAKLGAMAAPPIGGAILSTSLPVKQTYALLAVCPFVFGVCILIIGLMERRMRLRAATEAPPAAASPVMAAE